MFEFLAVALLATALLGGLTLSAPGRARFAALEAYTTITGQVQGKFKGSTAPIQGDDCQKLSISAHKAVSPNDLSGPQIASTHATDDGKGGCIYQMKIPAGDSYVLQVDEATFPAESWKFHKLYPTAAGGPGSSEVKTIKTISWKGTSQFLKIDAPAPQVVPLAFDVTGQ